MNTDIQNFITAARACIQQLLENAAYVRKELPNVGLPDPLRNDVDSVCDTWLEAKHDALTGLHEIAEVLESRTVGAYDLVEGCRRIHSTLGDVFEPTDRVVQQLRQAAFEDPRLGLAALLVMESVRNIKITFPAFVGTGRIGSPHLT